MRRVPRSILGVAVLVVGLLAMPWAPIQVRLHAAVAISELTSGANGTDASSFATASVTPASGAAVLVIVDSSDGVPVTPSSITGTSISNGTCSLSVTYATTRRLSLCRALSTGLAGAITIDYAGNSQSNQLWKVLEITGADVTSSGANLIVQTSVGTDTTGSTAAEGGTLSAFAAGSAVITAFGSNTNTNTCTVEGGTWVESGAEVSNNSPGSTTCAMWNLSEDTTPTATWGTSTNHRGISAEIKVAAAGGPPSGSLSLLGVGK